MGGPAAILIKDPAGMAITIQYANVTELPDGETPLYPQQPQAAPQQWIDVATQMPEDGQLVQVYCSITGAVGSAVRDAGDWLAPQPQDIEPDGIVLWEPMLAIPEGE